MADTIERKPDHDTRDIAPGAKNHSNIDCVVCTKLDHMLDSCIEVSGPDSLRAELDHLLDREVAQSVTQHVANRKQVTGQLRIQAQQNDESWHARCYDLEAQVKLLRQTQEKWAKEKSDDVGSLKRQSEENGIWRARCHDLEAQVNLLQQTLEKQIQEIQQNDGAWHARCSDLEAQIKLLQHTPAKEAQERSDYIEGLKRQSEEAEEEDKRLVNLLGERKQRLRKLQGDLMAREQPQAFTMKEAKKGKKGKKR
jgi:hypothetical protein